MCSVSVKRNSKLDIWCFITFISTCIWLFKKHPEKVTVSLCRVCHILLIIVVDVSVCFLSRFKIYWHIKNYLTNIKNFKGNCWYVLKTFLAMFDLNLIYKIIRKINLDYKKALVSSKNLILALDLHENLKSKISDTVNRLHVRRSKCK